MSLNINVDSVFEILLSDGWHTIFNKSFDIDSYEYTCDGEVLHGGGNSGVCATGFRFQDSTGDWYYGPLTAIQAVRDIGL